MIAWGGLLKSKGMAGASGNARLSHTHIGTPTQQYSVETEARLPLLSIFHHHRHGIFINPDRPRRLIRVHSHPVTLGVGQPPAYPADGVVAVSHRAVWLQDLIFHVVAEGARPHAPPTASKVAAVVDVKAVILSLGAANRFNVL